MNPLTKYSHLNTIEDDRWKVFQKNVRQSRIIAVGGTVVSGIAAFALQSVWIFLAGETVLWLGFLAWRKLKK